MPKVTDDSAVLLIPEMVTEQLKKGVFKDRRDKTQRQSSFAGNVAPDLTENRFLVLGKGHLETNVVGDLLKGVISALRFDAHNSKEGKVSHRLYIKDSPQ